MKRDSYLDIIKFLFAIMILFFHAGNEIFPGGRIAVEGYFMISGYFMMISIAKAAGKEDSLGVSTVKFLRHKYVTLAQYLIPAVLIAVCAFVAAGITPLSEAVRNAPLLLFEIIPMNAFGFEGYYVVGISWYLSSMLFALAVLYPLCRRFGQDFVLIVGIPVVLLIYGYLYIVIGSMAVPGWLMEPIPVPTRLLRGLAGCLAGCILYEAVKWLREYRLSSMGRAAVVLFEIWGFGYLFYACRKLAKSEYDYFLVFLIFALLLIGISGITGLKRYYSFAGTKVLGIVSTLIVLNHYQWSDFIIAKTGGFTTAHIPYYLLATGCSSALCYLIGNAVLNNLRGCLVLRNAK